MGVFHFNPLCYDIIIALMNIQTITTLTLAVLIQLILIYIVLKGYLKAKWVILPGLYLAHLTGFYISVLVVNPVIDYELNLIYTSWSGLLRLQGVLTILFIIVLYWYGNITNGS